MNRPTGWPTTQAQHVEQFGRLNRRNFALLRAIDDPSAQNRVRDLVLRAYDTQSHDSIEAVS
jgi:hypothetical protein